MVVGESKLQRALSENAALRLALKQAIEERDASAQKAAFATRRIEELQGKIRALMEQVALLERRIFAAKKERIDHQQLDLEFASTKKELDALQRELQGQLEAPSDETSDDGNKPSTPKPKAKPTGKRDLASCTSMPTQSIVITDPEGEALVLAGKASRMEAPPSYRLGYVRGGYTRVAITLTTYRVETTELGAEKRATLITALQAPTLFPRSLATPSLVAKFLIDKYADGLPLYRQEERFSREGLELDRGTTSRWVQTSGFALGPLMNAFKKHALDNAFCAAVDATGVLIQPALSERKGSHQACRRGHFFGIVIDKSAVAFEYTRSETSAAVQSMLGGFKGYVQSDAQRLLVSLSGKHVFDILDEREDAAPRLGCWAHCRRHFYDAAAVNRDKRALEALMRIGRNSREGNQPHRQARTRSCEVTAKRETRDAKHACACRSRRVLRVAQAHLRERRARARPHAFGVSLRTQSRARAAHVLERRAPQHRQQPLRESAPNGRSRTQELALHRQ